MCRSIKQLRRTETTTTTGEIDAAALQFIRKVSGFRAPSARNTDAFDAAVRDVASSSRRLLEALGVDVEDGPNRWEAGSGKPHGHPHPDTQPAM